MNIFDQLISRFSQNSEGDWPEWLKDPSGSGGGPISLPPGIGSPGSGKFRNPDPYPTLPISGQGGYEKPPSNSGGGGKPEYPYGQMNPPGPYSHDVNMNKYREIRQYYSNKGQEAGGGSGNQYGTEGIIDLLRYLLGGSHSMQGISPVNPSHPTMMN